MNKLLLLSALLCAASSKTMTTYKDANYACFYWDATTEAYIQGSYVTLLAEATSTDDAAGDSYKYAFDVTFDAYDGCDQVAQSAWNVEWTATAGDEASVVDMFTVVYQEWAEDSTGYCSGDYAGYISPTVADTAFASADVGLDVSDTVCAYDVYFYYDDGEDATPTAISATTQVVTVYTDNAMIAATSAFVLAGFASCLF